MKIVLTFGVYDILHLGHINLFKKAKEKGDYLIVAVQSGEFIHSYKPDAKIVYSTEERVFMVNSIKYVDEVIIYNNVDEAIKKINFDVFVKGEDQNHLGFVHALEWCQKHNKEIVTFKRTEGISSSLLRAYLKNA